MAKSYDNKIHLLHLVQTLGIGGAETLLLQTIPALGMEHFQHFVYCFGRKGHIRGMIENLKVPVIFGPKRYSIKNPVKFAFSLLKLGKHLNNFIKEHRIDVIQSHLGHSNQLGVAIGKLSGVPTFPTVHSTMALEDLCNLWDLRVYLRKAVNMLIYKKADKIITVSQEIKEIVLQKYGLKDSKVLVLKNGINFDDALIKPADLRSEFYFSENPFKIIAVGRLVPLKCYHVLVKAVAEVVNQGFENMLVIIAGDGNVRSELEELIHRLKLGNFIKILGLRHDVLQLMKACDVFVIPSRFEGLSIAMIEAMACGLPVIASDAPGLRDHIEEGLNGMLFPLEDHKALAENIYRLANDETLRERLSFGAKESFEREFDMRRNITPLSGLIRSMVREYKAK